MRFFLAALALVTFASCAHRTKYGPAANPASAEVVAVAERLFDAMRSHDAAALREVIHPQAHFYVVSSDQPLATVPVDDWIMRIASSSEYLDERIWQPEVRIDGDFATLWAPYDFHRDRKFSHCGIDSFQFVREAGQWKLLTIAFTRQTTGCVPPPK